MINKFIDLNKGMLKTKPLIFFANLITWTMIITLPLIYSYMTSSIFDSLLSQNSKVFMHLILGLTGITCIHLFLIYWGGILDTLFRFYSRTILQMKILKIKLNDAKPNINHAKTMNIISTDCLSLQELLSIQMDCLSHVIFYILGFIVLFKANSILSIILFMTTFFITNIIFLHGNNLKKTSHVARQHSLDEADATEKMILNANKIRYMDKKHKYINVLENLVKKNSEANVRFEIKKFILNDIGNSSYIISISVIFVFSLFAMKNTHVIIQSIILFLTYFLYGFNKIDIFIEFYNLLKSSEIAVENIIQVTTDTFFSTLTEHENLHNNVERINHIFINGKNIECGETELIKNERDLDEFLKTIHSSKFALGISRPKDTFLTDTIVNNIVFEEYTSNDKLEQILHIVNLSKELSERNIHEEVLSEGANTLSEGQKQRLSIARALYNSSGVILLYNVFDFIDKENVKKIMDNCKDNDYIVILKH